MRYWWVNQNQTYRHEIKGNFLWSPKANANGARNPFYDNMKVVEPGDIVFSFCDTRIRAIGVAMARAQTGPKPDFGTAGMNWSKEGWFVPMAFAEFQQPSRPKDHIDQLRGFLPAKYSPLRTTGDGQQSIYLAEVPGPLASALIDLIGAQSYFDALALLTEFPVLPDDNVDDESLVVETIPSTFREQLVRARRGQGIFRANVMLVESQCRVTGVDQPRHLRASHIKPWRDSTDEQRLSGHNGLLLSPHVDHLFDQGYLTFSSTGNLLFVPEVRARLLDRWGIDSSTRVGDFTREQQAYLDYHRAEVFKGKPRKSSRA